MYYYKEFKNREFKVLTAITKNYFTLGIQIHWNSITKKQCEFLIRDCYVLDLHFLCFDIAFDLWGKLIDDDNDDDDNKNYTMHRTTVFNM